jgi:ABC-type transporter Mla subunit MlaD
VLQILARQNRQLAQLATDSNTVLTPLARVKTAIADFVAQANTSAVASAARAPDISRSIQEFPPFLRALRPLVADLGTLADQGTPLMASLGQSATALGRQFQNLTPFARAARPALIALGKSSAQSQPLLEATLPLAQQLRKLGSHTLAPATSLDRLTASLDQTGAIEQLMSVLFYGVSAANGFDSVGHYVRTEPQVGSCTAYVKVLTPGCSANFSKAGGAAAAAAARPPTAQVARVATKAASAATAKPSSTSGALRGLLRYLIGRGR